MVVLWYIQCKNYVFPDLWLLASIPIGLIGQFLDRHDDNAASQRRSKNQGIIPIGRRIMNFLTIKPH